MKLSLLIIWIAVALPEFASAQNPADDIHGSPESLKRILPATAAPEGSLEIGVLTEFSTLSFSYGAFDELDNEVEFTADKFHAWTTELTLSAGLFDDVEFDLVVPLVFAQFEASGRDRLSRHVERNDYGVGDVEVAISYGWESEDETLFALLSLGAELPTNTLDDFFGGKTRAGVGAIEVEKYFGSFGLIGGIESKFEDDSWSHEYLAGMALIPNDKLYSQVFFARNSDGGINRVEATIEYLFSEAFSMEWLLSQEVSGTERETIVGVGFNFFFGEPDEFDD